MRRHKLKSTYSDDITLYWDCSMEEFARFLKKRCPTYKGGNDFGYGFADRVKMKDCPDHFYICLTKAEKRELKSYLIHEIEHLTFMLLKYVGVPHTTATDEVFAYTNQDFYDQVSNILKL